MRAQVTCQSVTINKIKRPLAYAPDKMWLEGMKKAQSGSQKPEGEPCREALWGRNGDLPRKDTTPRGALTGKEPEE